MPNTRPTTKKAKKAAVKQVMHEFKAEALTSSSGQKVTNPKQPLAIAMHSSGQATPKQSKRPASRRKSTPFDVVTVQRS